MWKWRIVPNVVKGNQWLLATYCAPLSFFRLRELIHVYITHVVYWCANGAAQLSCGKSVFKGVFYKMSVVKSFVLLFRTLQAIYITTQTNWTTVMSIIFCWFPKSVYSRMSKKLYRTSFVPERLEVIWYVLTSENELSLGKSLLRT